MNPLKRGLEAVKAVRKNKLMFVVLILVQILFIVSISFVGVKYQLKIYENAKGIIEPLEGMDYNESLTAEDPMMKEMMKEVVGMVKHYEEMVKNIFMMIFFIFGCFLVFDGFSWSLVNYVVKKNNILIYWKRFVLVSLVFLVPFSLISYLVLKSMIGVNLEVFGQVIKIFYLVFLVVGYFMLVGFCLVEERLKDLLKKIFLIGLRQMHWILLSLMFVLLGVLLSLVLIYLAGDNFWLMTFGMLILVIVFVLGRFFMVGVVKELKE